MEETFQIRCYNDLLCHFNSNEYQFVDVQCILRLENFKNTFNVDALSVTQVRDFSFTASRDPIGPFSSDSTICSAVRQAYGSMLGDDDG